MTNIGSLLSGWLLYAAGMIAMHNQTLISFLLLFLFFFIADFVTGLFSSIKQGKSFQSSKARWSFAKTFCYLGTFAAICIIGVCFDQFATCLKVLKFSVLGAVWIESVSNLENLIILFPYNRFLRFMHFLLAVEWVNKVPGLSNFLKEEKNKAK